MERLIIQAEKSALFFAVKNGQARPFVDGNSLGFTAGGELEIVTIKGSRKGGELALTRLNSSIVMFT